MNGRGFLGRQAQRGGIGGELFVADETNGSWGDEPDSYTYQWQRCSETGTECSNISGATSTNLTVSSVSDSDAASYSVVISNAGGSITSVVSSSRRS